MKSLFGRSFLFALAVLLVVSSVDADNDQPEILVPGETLSGSVGVDAMHCYDIPVQRSLDDNGDWGSTKAYRLIIIVRRNSPTANFQIFASRDGWPTRTNYDFANLVSAPSQTLFVEGLDFYEDVLTTCVYGKTAGSYSIYVQLVVITPLMVHASTPVIVDAGRWSYFQYNLTDVQDDQYFLVALSGASSGVVVRLSTYGVPDRFFDEERGTSNVTVFFPPPRMWYIALENTATARYQGTLTISLQNIVSTPFVPGSTVAIQMYDHQIRYYYFDASGITKPKLMSVHVDVYEGDPDVYISENSLPREDIYDYHDASWQDEFTLDILVQQDTRYYFEIECYEDNCDFDISVSMTDFSVTKVSNNSILTQTPTEDWVYAEVEVPSTSGTFWQLIVNVNATEGDPDIFVRYDKFPTPHDSTIYDTSSNTQSSVSVVNAKPGKWYIGIQPNGEVAYRWTVLIVPMQLIQVESGTQYIGSIANDWNYENNLRYISVDTGNAGDYALLSITVVATLPSGSDDGSDEYSRDWSELTISGQFNQIPENMYLVPDEQYAHSHDGKVILTIPQPNATWYFIVELPEGATFTIEAQLANAKALSCDAMTDSGVTGTYNFYFYDFDRLSYLNAQLDSLSSSGGAELYVAHSYLPGRLSSEFSSVGDGASKQLQVPPTQLGRVYIGVYITSSLTYTISACKLDLDIPVLTPGVSVSNSLAPNNWDYYYIDFGPSSGDLIYLTLKSKDKTPSIYIQEGEFPTDDSNLAFVKYDFDSPKVMLLLLDPVVDRYYVGVANEGHGTVTVNYTILPAISFKDDLAKPLKPLDVASGSVSRFSWAFYSVYVGNISSSFYLVMASVSGDPDIYVSYGHLPSKSNFTYSSTSMNERSIIAMKPTLGFWYIGIFGYRTTNQYSLYVHFGDTRIPFALSNGIQVQAYINWASWKDYSIQVNFGSMLVIQVNSNYPVTIYVRQGDLPETDTYSKKSTITTGTIYITDLQYGTYFISVRGQANTKCSLTSFFGGKCFTPSCVCASPDCNSQTLAATSGTVYNGLVDEGYWNNYMLNVNSGFYDLSLAFQTSFATKDKIYCYLKYGSLPTNTSYDYMTGLDPGQRKIQIIDVPSGIVYFSIYGASVIQYGTYSVQVNLTQYGACPNHCSGHGDCIGGICSCNPQWTGSDCSTYGSTLSADVPNQLSGHLRPNTYNYFTIVGNENSASTNLFLQAILTSSQSTGKIQIFANVNGNAPTSSTFDAASVGNETSPSLTIKKMSNQKKVTVAVYCLEGLVDYSVSTLPVEAEHSAGKVVLILFIIFVVFAIVGAGVYYLRKHPMSIKPFGSRSTKRTPRRRTEDTNRLFDEDQEAEDIETQESSSSANFASALSKATEEDDNELFDSIRSNSSSDTTTTQSIESSSNTAATTTTTPSSTNLLDL